MTGFVAGFHVHKHEVVLLEGLNGCLGLAFVVGVSESCGSRYLDDAQASIASDALNQVNGRDDGPAFYLWILLHEGLHRRTVATAPRPDAVGLAFALLSLGQIIGVLGQQFLRLQYQFVQQVGGLLGGEAVGVGDRIADHTGWFYQ